MRNLVGWFLVLICLSGFSLGAQKRHKRSKRVTEKTVKKAPVPCVTCDMTTAPDLAEQLAKWKPVLMPFHSDGLTPNDIKVVQKLVDATRYLDDIYWRQSDPEGLSLYEKLKPSNDPK